MSLHLNLQCQRADKNTDTRITSPLEEACSIRFFAAAVEAREALRCGDTPLSGRCPVVNRLFPQSSDRQKLERPGNCWASGCRGMPSKGCPAVCIAIGTDMRTCERRLKSPASYIHARIFRERRVHERLAGCKHHRCGLSGTERRPRPGDRIPRETSPPS